MQEAKTKRLADVLNRARWEKEYTYKKVADLTGINYNNVWSAMNGEILPRERNLRKLASALELDGDALLKIREIESKKRPRVRKKAKKRVYYTIYDKVTEKIIVELGTVEECAKALGIRPNSFAVLMARQRNPEKYKYYESDKRWKITKTKAKEEKENET